MAKANVSRRAISVTLELSETEAAYLRDLTQNAMGPLGSEEAWIREMRYSIFTQLKSALDCPEQGVMEITPHDDPLKCQCTPRVNGKPFHCICGGNVFTRLKSMDHVYGVYECNACHAQYEGETAAPRSRP